MAFSRKCGFRTLCNVHYCEENMNVFRFQKYCSHWDDIFLPVFLKYCVQVLNPIFRKPENVIQMTILRSENEEIVWFSLIYVAQCSKSHFWEVKKCHPNDNLKGWKREHDIYWCSMLKTTQTKLTFYQMFLKFTILFWKWDWC